MLRGYSVTDVLPSSPAPLPYFFTLTAFNLGEPQRARCEGMTRHGGIMTLGRPYWTQCENGASVMLTVEQTPGGWGHDATEGSFPACNDCWGRAVKEDGVTVVYVKPLRLKRAGILSIMLKRLGYRGELNGKAL